MIRADGEYRPVFAVCRADICPFFDLGFDAKARVLTVAVDSAEQVPALDAISFALGAEDAT